MGFLIVFRGITRRFRRSSIVFVGIILAVASLVTLEAIMQGVTDAMIRNSVAIHHGHVNVSWSGNGAIQDIAAEWEKTLPDVRAAIPRRRLVGTLVRGERQVPVTLYGVEPSAESKWTVVSGNMLKGKYLSSRGEVVLGVIAAEVLDVSVNQQIAFWRKGADSLDYQVSGIYHTGIDQLDRQMCFVWLDDVPVEGSQNEVAVFLASETSAARVADQIREKLPPTATVRTWQDSLAELVQLTALNRVSMNIVLALALLILAFGVANTAYISINERMHEFGVLKAMGVTPGGIMMLAQAETFLIVTLAGLLGVLLGVGISIILSLRGLDLSQWTSENRHFVASSVVYPHVAVRGVILPMLVAVVCGLLASSLPARRAGRVNVVEALRRI